MSERKRDFTYTLNNFTDDDIARLENIDCVYHVFGKEVAPTTGTPHLQGYIYFKSQRSLKAIRKLIKGHVVPSKGNSLQNYTYCTKEGDFKEIGARPLTAQEKGDMEKDRWKSAMEAAKRGDFDAIPDDLRTRYYRTYKQIHTDYLHPKPDLDGVCGIWIYGPPGSGKSRKARSDFPGIFDKPLNKWFDGYVDGPILLDDFDLNHSVLGHHLKRWADRYAFNAEVKGGTINARPSKVVVTSNYQPNQIWEDPVLIEAIERRFEIIFWDHGQNDH